MNRFQVLGEISEGIEEHPFEGIWETISVSATQYKVLKRNKIKTGIMQAPKISLTTGGTLKER